MKTKLGITFLAVLVAILSILLTPLAAAAEGEQPSAPIAPFPTRFFGDITINGAPAPVGTQIYGCIVDGAGTFSQQSISVKVAGKYGGPEPTNGKLLVQTNNEVDNGKCIEFYVKAPWWTQASKAAETSVFDSELHAGFNLSATGSAGGGGGGGGGGGAGGGSMAAGAPAYDTITTNFFGQVGSIKIDSDGVIQENFTATSPDGKLIFTLLKGTIAKDAAGKPISGLTGTFNSNPPVPPVDTRIIGQAFNLEPGGVTFDPAMGLVYSYDPASLPASVVESDLALAFYDTAAEKWVNLASAVDQTAHTLTASIPHFTTFAVLGPTSAIFTPALKSISPQEAEPGQQVTIIISVANSGAKDGTYKAVLMINGAKEQEQDVAVAAGKSVDATFTVTRDQPGAYTVSAAGQEGSFTVVKPPEATVQELTSTPSAAAAPVVSSSPTAQTQQVEPSSNMPLIIGIIGAIVVIAGIIIFMFFRKRKPA